MFQLNQLTTNGKGRLCTTLTVRMSFCQHTTGGSKSLVASLGFEREVEREMRARPNAIDPGPIRLGEIHLQLQ